LGRSGKLADPAEPLWINGYRTFAGFNDKVPIALADTLTSSLRLIHVTGMALAVFKPGEAFGNPKRRVQGHFTFNGTPYRLWVTDPGYERTYLARPDGEYAIGESFLTVSLGEPHDDACYKLIAAISEREGA
jgi:hypothetical protein